MGKDAEFFALSQDEQIVSLTQAAAAILHGYGISGSELECINYEFNATFKVTTDSAQIYVLRININSTRTAQNIMAEIEWVQYLQRTDGIHVATPIANHADQFITSFNHGESGRVLLAVMYTWLEGSEVGDEPSLIQLHQIGQTIALLHESAKDFQLTSRAKLPEFKDLLWGTQDFLFGERSVLESDDRELLLQASNYICRYTDELYEKSQSHIIHADLHGWNIISHESEIFIFDFDDCGIGLAAQDIAVALYYLDTPEQEVALLNGYKSVMPLPEYSDIAMKALLLQRRLMLLNYLYETNNHEHRQMLPAYLAKTIERVSRFLVEVSESNNGTIQNQRS